MKRKLRIGAVLILAIFLASCVTVGKSFVKDTYKVLGTSKASYEAAMEFARDLYHKGELSDEHRTKISNFATTYYNAHNSAVILLGAYKAGDSKVDLNSQLTIMSEALVELLGIVKTYIGEKNE